MGKNSGKKVLYIGHYYEGSGWAQAAINYILAMDSVGIDVVCRPVRVSPANAEVPDRIKKLEEKSAFGAKVCVQHILPHLMDYCGDMQHIGLVILETNDIRATGWKHRLSLMDKLWCANKHIQLACSRSGITVDSCVIPHAFNLEEYNDVEPLDLGDVDEHSFKFYFIGENIRRKRLAAVLRAYFTEFSENDNVLLVLKVSDPRFPLPDELSQHMYEIIRAIQNELKIYASVDRYPPVIVIPDRLTREALLGLHQTCDCFVMPSFGEAWCIPAFEAVAMGNLCLASDTGGFREYIHPDHLLRGAIEPVFGSQSPFADVYCGRTSWYNVDIIDLQASMREVYEMSSKKREEYKQWYSNTVSNFSYENVGNMIKEII